MATYKKNLTNKLLYKLFSNSPSDMYKFTTTNIMDGFYDNAMTSATNGIFKAVCLSGIRTGDNTGTGTDKSDGWISSNGNFILIIVRPLTPFGDILPDPRLSTTPEKINEAISNHLTMWTAKSDFEFKDQIPISFGQVINCYFEDGSIPNSDFRGLRFQEPVGETYDESFRKLATTSCEQSAQSAFNGNNPSLLGSGSVEYPFIGSFKGKNSQDPTFTNGKCKNQSYPSLPRKDGMFYKYDKSTVVKAIKNSGQSISTQKIMYGIIKHEQGKLHFPGNNPAGIQLDFGAGKRPFGGANQSSFDYQFCLQDNGGDWRIFAGFNDLGKGMKVFGIIIGEKAKITGKHAWKPLEGTNDQQAERMTENYYVNWNTKFTRAEVETLKKTNQVVRDKKVYTRHWKPSKKVFIKAFQEFDAL